MQSLIVLLLFECPFCFLVVVLGFVEPDEVDEPENAEQLLPELANPLAETGVIEMDVDDA